MRNVPTRIYIYMYIYICICSFSDNFLCADMVLLHLLALCGSYLFSLLMAFLLVLWRSVIRQQRFLIVVEWNILVVSVYIELFLILVGLISGFSIII